MKYHGVYFCLAEKLGIEQDVIKGGEWQKGLLSYLFSYKYK